MNKVAKKNLDNLMENSIEVNSTMASDYEMKEEYQSANLDRPMNHLDQYSNYPLNHQINGHQMSAHQMNRNLMNSNQMMSNNSMNHHDSTSQHPLSTQTTNNQPNQINHHPSIDCSKQQTDENLKNSSSTGHDDDRCAVKVEDEDEKLDLD